MVSPIPGTRSNKEAGPACCSTSSGRRQCTAGREEQGVQNTRRVRNNVQMKLLYVKHLTAEQMSTSQGLYWRIAEQ